MKIVDRGVMAKRSARKLVVALKNMPINLRDSIDTKDISRLTIRRTESNFVVVVHLYYIESWDTIKKYLRRLNGYDLIVTMPKKNKYIAEKIKKEFKNSTIVLVPNRGRDVLSFTLLLSKIQSAGYPIVLKIHSKKSTHRKDGDKWFIDMLEKLVPHNAAVLENIMLTLSNDNSSIIGPEGHYVSLKVNFEQNKHYLYKTLKSLYGAKLSAQVMKTPGRYGFFAGTMFWARVDALDPVISYPFKVRDFDVEKGQIDSTLAHGLERAFCIIPEIGNMQIFETNGKKIQRIQYSTPNIPDWTDVQIK